MQLHDSQDPRHARMFELLRQSQHAQSIAQRLDVWAKQHADLTPAQKFQQAAVKSLIAPRD